MKNIMIFCFISALALVSCSETEDIVPDKPVNVDANNLIAVVTDGLYEWNTENKIALIYNGETSIVQAEETGKTSILPNDIELTLTNENPLYAVTPADNFVSSGQGCISISIPATQSDGGKGYDEKSVVSVARTVSDSLFFKSIYGGIKLNFQMSGVTKVEIESVDNYALSGIAKLVWDNQGSPVIDKIENANSIITFTADGESGFISGKDYYISTLPCNVYGGYRLSIYKDGLVAHFFSVHQTIERANFIMPIDLIESELEFDDPNAPLVEESRPELDATTNALLRQYQKEPTEENKNALLVQMGIRYDKVVARKKAKLRELERESKTQNLVDEMQAIVDEMVENREIRLEQQFLRLIDPRNDDNPNDQWMVLRGASAPNAYIGYAPVTNAEYALFNKDFTYNVDLGNYPVVNISIAEADAYCEWLSSKDKTHVYRLPTDEEWVLGAGHMPKDVAMNSGHVTSGLTAVDAYKQTTGVCGGIDFWGNCWEWTSSTDVSGSNIVKGGSWSSDRDDCRSEKSDIVKVGTQGHADVGFRVVRIDS